MTENPASREEGRINSLDIAMLGTNAYSLPARLRSFQELSQLLLEDLQALRARCIGHTKQWTPQVEHIGDIGTDAQKNEEDEVDWVSEHCFT